MATSRSIKSKLRKQKKGSTTELDITSLLDVLVILIFFLIRSYNTSGIDMSIPAEINLPVSKSETINNAGVQIQVSPDKIWVDSKEILNSESITKNTYDQGGRRIIPLYDELVKKKEEIKAIALQTKYANDFSGRANLIIDKSLKYSYVKKLMYTCAEAGFKEFKFVVMSEEQ